MSTLDEYKENGIQTETSLQLEDKVEQIDNVLQNFDVYILPTKFDRFMFNHTYIFLIGLLLGELLSIPLFISQPQFIPLPQVWKGLLLVALPMIVIFSILVTFNLWRLKAPKMLKDLIKKKRIYIPDGNANIPYLCFLERYCNAVRSPKRYFLSVFLMIVFVIFSAFGVVLTFSIVHLGIFVTILSAVGILLSVLSYLGGIYCGGIVCWLIYVSGTNVRRLVHTFDLRIQPFHTDKCGGFNLLGNFCFDVVAPILIGSGLLIGYILFYFITGSIGGSRLESAYQPIFVGLPLLLLLNVPPSIIFAFVFPLRDIHTKMVREREKVDDIFNTRIESLREEIQLELDKGTVKGAKSLQEKKAMLETLYTPYPTWPFGFRSKILYTILGASGSLLTGMVTAALPLILPLIYQKL